MAAAFLYRTFVQPNVRTLPQGELVTALRDYLYTLNEQSGSGEEHYERPFRQSAEHYLSEWCADDHGWLRKYYRAGTDEPHFDITPATEKAIDWIGSLLTKQFVGTESRLLTVFALLRELIEGTEVDPEARIAELERRRAQVDLEIQQVREGRMAVLDDTQIRDRFLQMASTAQGLRSDFRTVDQNFRELDRAVRERIATWDGSKGALLEEIFGHRDAIADSDQGRSFRAFWDFLMSPARQEELSTLLGNVFALAPVQELAPDRRLLRIHYDWMEAGEEAQRTVARLSEQLRRYLDDQVWLENRRITQIIKNVEQSALAVRDEMPSGSFMEIDESAPTLEFAMDRPLFSPPARLQLTSTISDAADAAIPADALFSQMYVDKAAIEAHIRRSLQSRSQISLSELLDSSPLKLGLAELIGYLSVAAESPWGVIQDDETQVVSWVDGSDRRLQATLPLVIFTREALAEGGGGRGWS